VLPVRAGAVPAVAALVALVSGAAAAAPVVSGPGACALELRGRDASGNTVLQTVAYALDRPGLVLAPLSPAAGLRGRWRDLWAVRDPGPEGSRDLPLTVAVTEVLMKDDARDLVLLRAPGVAACDGALDAGGAETQDVTESAAAPSEGDSLLGLRDRDGYRPRLFTARLDKTILLPAGSEILRVRIPDGGGAGSGFLFDRRHRLLGSILPPPPGGDRQFACAVPIDRRALDAAASGPGLPVSDALARLPDPDRGAVALWAQALLLTRDDQADRAISLLDDVARLGGESAVLLMERGARSFGIGRTDRAIADFERAARLNPDLHLARFDLGVAYGAAGRYDEAIDAFTRALEIAPLHAQTHYQLALALLAARRPDRARLECDRLERIDPAMARELRANPAF